MSDNNRAESAIDMIFNLSSQIEHLDKKLTVIDSNLKLLNNKVSKLSKQEQGRPLTLNVDRDFKNNSDNVIIDDEEGPGGLRLGNVSVFGHIIDGGKNPIDNVLVTLYDSKNKLIKDISSNKDGFWSVRLSPGDYSVKYEIEGYKDIRRKFELKDNMKRYEVK
jgi:hypothetical protein